LEGGETGLDLRAPRPGPVYSPAMRVVGLMSGTSADAVDAALVEWPEGDSASGFRLLAFEERPHTPVIQAAIHRLAAGDLPAESLLGELVRLDRVLGDLFADATEALLEGAGFGLESVDAVASHGQTIAHHPEQGGTLQIGCPARLAERLQKPVVADFRRRDMARGGEGAPLAPFFHHAVFADASEPRGVLNLGGIANLTWLPAGGDPDRVIAFDVGPANSLTDAVLQIATDGRLRFDANGERARAGRIRQDWLDEMLDDEFLDRPPPRSTGRERYGLAEAQAWWQRACREPSGLEDLLATLTRASTTAIAQAWHRLTEQEAGGRPGRLLVGGGGARNGLVMDTLAELLPGLRVEPMEAAGVPAAAAEAMAFSLMGRNALRGEPNQLPQCTGVVSPAILGVVHGAEWWTGMR